MGTPFNYSGQAYDPFNQRVRGQAPGYPQPQATQAQPVQAGAYPSAPTGAVAGQTPQAPVYQGPPAQGGQSQYPSSGSYGQQTQPPGYSQQGQQTPVQTSGWIQQPYPQQQVPPSQYPNTGVVAPSTTPHNTGTVPPWWQQQSPSAPRGPEFPIPQQPPQAPPQARFSPTAMPGWDQGKWQDPGKHDAKYDAGRLMSTLAPSVANIPQVLGMLQQQGHQVQYGGGDTAVIDGFTVDLVQGSHSDHPAWQWMVPQGAPPPGQDPQAISGDPYLQFLSSMMSGGVQSQQQAPQQQQGGADQTALLQAIMQLLQQQNAAPRGPVAPNFSFY